ncbi:MAG: V-type ATPase 116kDa subunit family protein, partial [Phycisphaerae bacterium]
MAIARMTKIMIVCHRSQAAELLEDLQSSGICQILNAEEAMVSKEYPELGVAGERPRQIEQTLGEITKSISFLKDYAELPKGLSVAFSPRRIISKNEYEKLSADKSILELSSQAVNLQQSIERVKSEIENLQGHLRYLEPWVSMDIPVEELKSLSKSNCFAGLIASNKLQEIQSKLDELGAVIEKVSTSGTRTACIAVCLRENAGDIQKLLRSVDFEMVSFESMTGTVSHLQQETKTQLEEKNKELEQLKQQAAVLGKEYFKLTAAYDYYVNLLQKEQTHSDCPATEQAVIFEGWAKQKDYNKLVKIVSKFDASEISEIPPAEGEETPVDIDNKGLVKPFEFITRLYGMPHPTSVDPTIFLAPFFAIFFGLCITDAGYGIILAVLLYWLMKKLQAGKAAVFMFFLCAIMTIIAGALTGSWFADAAQSLIPA